jgi:lipopolysaccharide transport system ATP-binding protein
VGTGFHPELTGRENIFLNGAILGMKRREIQRKFDEIVDFAEVEKFLDTPVKRYSSGMYVRLAFAVAAHLEPEILIVDEVLAVGDAEFQKKCLGKMDEVSNQGRTVLFVSHNMDAIERLCGKVIWLQNGSILQNSSNVSETLKHYLHGTDAFSKALEWIKPHGTKSSPYFDLLKLRITDVNGNIAPRIFARDTIMQIRLEAHIDLSDKGLNIGYAIYSDDGTVIYWSCTTDSEEAYWPVLTPGTNLLVTALPIEILNEGNYTIEVMASLHNRQWIIEPRKTNINIAFEISGRLSKSPFWFSKRPGVIAPVYRWNKVHEY